MTRPSTGSEATVGKDADSGPDMAAVRPTSSGWQQESHQMSRRTALARSVFTAIFGAVLVGCATAGAAPAPDQVFRTEKAAFRVVEVVGGLSHPWSLAFLPDGRMLVTERPGRLRSIDEGRLAPDPIEGVPEVLARGQGGLLDVVLDPSFAENGLVYLSYSHADASGTTTRVLRARLGNGELVDAQVIFDGKPRASGRNHYGSRLAFGPDGMLYITMGERQERDRAQELDDHGGKILRIAPDGAVPRDNPFVGRAGALPEIWSYGHRNAQGLAFRPGTEELWEQEHGARGGDEVNLVRKGANYGWPVITHGIDYSGAPIGEGKEKEGMEQPLHVWTPSIAPSGLAFYQGDAFPEWQGDMLVGALQFELLVRLTMDDQRITGEERMLEGELGRIRDVRVGPDGLVYLLNDEEDGGVYRLEPAD
jgi:glucose/arabinose dehydrogenase